jgi:amino acid adenylation domain-containing protein/thioester reductase-like protein
MKGFWSEFLKVAEKYPEYVALRDNGKNVTYAELRDRAAGIGAWLAGLGAGLETPVGLNMEKSAAYVIGLLGVWHAGAAFVPLPPSLPARRQDYIIREAGIKHFVSPRDVEHVKTAAAAPFPVKADTLAYVIYTSGSTGNPKGVMVEHRGVANLCAAQRKAFRMKPGSRSLFYLSVNFDASVSDICVALSSGAALVMRPEEELKDGAALKRALQDEQITHIDMPPSLLRALSPDDMPASLETVVIGGEAAAADAVRSWAARFRVVNVYGPTEATVCTSLNVCGAGWDLPLLGDPLPGVKYVVFGDELYIGGDVLARGYLNQPALTAEKFVVHNGKRLYRTGDRVHRRDDGSLEFLGRIDRQFKLRGQLVEPDEVEARLRAHPQVMKAAVLKRDGRLVAFVCLSDPAAAKVLPEWLARFLPAWMVPQHFETVARLPLTASGKTDYAGLAKLRLNDGAAKRVAPRGGDEQKLWNIWRAVLKHEDFGVTDAFYAVGGDSLGIIRLTLEAERQGLLVSPALFSGHATIRAQAKQVARAHSGLRADTLRREVAFDAAMRATLSAAAKRPEAAQSHGNLLLTGATGFLGSRVLGELLRRTTGNIYCLVRAADEDGGRRRLRDAIEKFRVPLSAADWGRVIPVPGDLSQPQAGLGDETWRSLSENIDAIYHCAACVNMILPYSDMRAANVGGARTMLELACAGRRKTLHNASTLSVFVATNHNKGVLRETDRLEKVDTVYGGYAQTKFAAEYMLSQTPAGAVAIYQYRFGLLTGDVTTGASSPTDFLTMFAKGISRLGAVPDGAGDDLKVDITPVCHAAAAMVQLSLAARPGTYHIAGRDGLTLEKLCAALERRGHRLKRLPVARWAELANNKPLTAEESAAALALCRAIPGDTRFERHRTMDLFQATDVVFDAIQADAILDPASIACPAATDALVDTYMRWFFRAERKTLKICLFGPESTGKSTLAKKLAGALGAPFVAEYAQAHIARRNGAIDLADIPKIAAGQTAAEAAAERAANGLLICDTDLLTTCIWSDRLFGECPQWIRDAAELQHYDLYLLMDVDTPWVADVHRYLPRERASFLSACRDALASRGRPYVMLSGSWDEKFDAARAAIEGLAGQKQEKAA